MLFAFTSENRLNQSGVVAVLKRGRRLASAGFDIRYLVDSRESRTGSGRIAIAVPKKLIRSAVARNKIKRLVREAYRCHQVAREPLEMLVNCRLRNKVRDPASCRAFRSELSTLFDNALRRVQAR